jgi:cbb3-type cytochrome oxidase subunit 3
MSAPAAAQPNGPVLRDIHLPPSPSWWPLAPGWWFLIVLALLAVGLAIWWWRRQRRRHAEEKQVLAEVDQVLALRREQPQALASGLHQLLRRGALRIDATAAQQRGDAWRQTLAMMPVDADTLGQLDALEAAMYKPGAPLDADAAASATRRWLQLAWRKRAFARMTLAEVRP